MIGLILIGESNSGKSTIGHKIAEISGARYISSGDIARRMATTDKERDSLNSGNMAPEQLMRENILKEIVLGDMIHENDNNAFILDGFPRFEDQYRWLKENLSCKLIFAHMYAPYDVILERARSRGRDDDKSIGIKHQFFIDKTLPMISAIIDDNNDMYVIHTESNEDKDIKIKLLSDILGGKDANNS